MPSTQCSLCYRGNLTPRIVYSIIVEVLVFIVTVALAMNDSSSWSGEFFWITMVSVVVLNSAFTVFVHLARPHLLILPYFSCRWNLSEFCVWNGSEITIQIYRSGCAWLQHQRNLYIGREHFKFVLCIVRPYSGHLLFYCGHVRAAGLLRHLFCLTVKCEQNLFGRIWHSEHNIVCVWYFQKFYRYHEMLHEKEMTKSKVNNGGSNSRPPYFTIFKQTSPQLFNIFFVFFVTLAIFPAVHSGKCFDLRVIFCENAI